MADSIVIVSQQANNVVITNSDPEAGDVITQNLVVTSTPTVQIVSPNTNPGLSIIAYSQPPQTSSASGYAGEIRFDNNFIYICVIDNVWKKASLQDL